MGQLCSKEDTPAKEMVSHMKIIIFLHSIETYLLKSMETITQRAKLLFLDRKLYSHCWISISLTDFQLKDPPKYARLNKALFLQPKGQRPPSPPRQLKDIYASDILADEFLDYLKELDAENENVTLQTYLNFVIKCDQLRQASSKKETQTLFTEMSNQFFNCPQR